MTDLRVHKSSYSVSRVQSDDRWGPARGTRDGALFVEDWKQALVMEGRGYHVTIGAFSTPIVGGGAVNVIDINRPEGIISVPDGTAIIPVRISVQCHTPLIATDADESEILVAVDDTSAWNSDGTSTEETIYNMRTDTPRASLCAAESAFTANTTDPVLDLELAHAVRTGDFQSETPACALWGGLSLLYEPTDAPIIMGPAMLCVYWGGTVATNAFAQIEWLELPETAFR